MDQSSSVKVWYKSWWGIGLTIIFFYALVPYLVWTRTDWHKALKIGITALCLLLVVGIISENNKNEEEASNLLTQAEALYDNGNLNKAKELLNQVAKIDTQGRNSGLTALQAKVTQAELERSSKLDSLDFLKKVLVEMSATEFDLLKKGELRKDFLSYAPLNKIFLVKLKEQADKRATYIAEAEDKKKLDKVWTDLETQRIAKEERTKLLEKQFSGWDGSHLQLTRAIKESMKDPKSYQHVETTYVDKGEYLIVTTSYRGKNGFGAMVLEKVSAKVGIDGTVLEILEQ